MARLTLLRGPAGAGKSQRARELLRDNPDAILADTSATWVMLSGIERDPVTGLYPVREDGDPRLGVARYIRRTIANRALELGLDVVATISDSDQAVTARWRDVAAARSAEFVTETLDPGIAAIRARLGDGSGDDELSPECERALSRWYG